MMVLILSWWLVGEVYREVKVNNESTRNIECIVLRIDTVLIKRLRAIWVLACINVITDDHGISAIIIFDKLCTDIAVGISTHVTTVNWVTVCVIVYGSPSERAVSVRILVRFTSTDNVSVFVRDYGLGRLRA